MPANRFYFKPEFTDLAPNIRGKMGTLATDLMIHYLTIGPGHPIHFPRKPADLPRKALKKRGVHLITKKNGRGMKLWTVPVGWVRTNDFPMKLDD